MGVVANLLPIVSILLCAVAIELCNVSIEHLLCLVCLHTEDNRAVVTFSFPLSSQFCSCTLVFTLCGRGYVFKIDPLALYLR